MAYNHPSSLTIRPEAESRTLQLVIWTALSLSPLPREFAQPATDMLMGLWSNAASSLPAALRGRRVPHGETALHA